ncbi:MAG TPA: hypothetical protein VHA52_00770, partial [Candidatus Babeliaceae bacterium]|nr:hypothetical protein [Candidatus Babeliaceae bacterium]
ASAMYVPKSSVVISAESKYVLSDHNNTIRKIQVTTGNESDGKIEVFGDLQPGKQVIVNANDEIKETENHM